ncbi:serine hydrolase [Olivibacter sitiensis]|uniref:serine hydrolase n=1 Tax=Olivibacter sitiensis TaxID=376470 RepID=UPI0004181697|nr:serine hydrolase [Olivibacter sitiensis]
MIGKKKKFFGFCQDTIPLDKTNEFLSGLKKQVGNITQEEFVAFQQGTYASYKTTFERAVLILNLSLDDQNQINGLFLKPFEEKRNAAGNTVNALGNIPQEQAQLIFDRTGTFSDKTQLSIAVIENGAVKYYGIIKENDSLKTIDNKDSVFEIGSITKVFTATLLADAVLEQKIKLDDNINTFYDFPFKDDIAISFVGLANHASGLPRLPSNLGLGWHILKAEWGKDIYWHNGGTGGYSSSMAMDTINSTGIVILSNV